jgi:pimeloyl-ACP methyl ester carboxylesterase
MPIVFVHGVPETASVWDGVRSAISGESVAVSLPGFRNPRPGGFPATKEAYASWLREQLDEIDEPIDLVGHDWGAILVTRIVTTDSDRIRSWATDAVASFHPDYVWHEFARLWQTPGEGEAFYETYDSLPPDNQAAMLTASGVPEAFAPEMSRPDKTMEQCILDLYRSATDVYGDWGTSVQHVPMPGLVLLPPNDIFAEIPLARNVAKALGARTETLDGLGHWWMLEDPERAASHLGSFWSSL